MEFYLKRLLDYIRLQIASGTIGADSPVGIAYRDYLEHAARQDTMESPGTATNTTQPAIALKDIESFIVGRMGCAIPAQMIGAYRDVLFLVRQHINSAQQQAGA